MIEVIPYPGATPHRLHPTWADRALPDIGNATLRQTLLASPRFASRIVDSLAVTTIPVVPLPADNPVATVAALVGQDFLAQLGALWLSPLLAGMLLVPTGRAQIGLADRDTLRLVLRYQDHVDPCLIGALSPSPNFTGEGTSCLAAWLEAQDSPSAARLRLILPADLPFDEESRRRARIALVDRTLADPDVTGV